MSRAAGSPASTSSTYATGPPPAAGTSARPPRRPPTPWSRARARATSRRTSGSRASRSRRGWIGRTRPPARRARAPMDRREDTGAERVRARVLIRPKAGILDPQGAAVERALPALGFAGVANVHVGRLLELDVEDPSHLQSMCEKLLEIGRASCRERA